MKKMVVTCENGVVRQEVLDMTPEEIASIPRIIPTLVPATVSRFQMREALIETPSPDKQFPNALALIDFAFSNRSDRASRAWAEASVISRNSPAVGAFAEQFGWTESQVDDLFRRAAAIEA